ncbi:phosphate signaling complex protein PhoU [Vibrio sp.]|nr:phosphate signaling complex protein PhoU [Vibrio sp.]
MNKTYQATAFRQHISGRFNHEIESVRSQVLAMGGLVEQQLSYAIASIKENNISLAQKVVDSDSTVNDMELSIDESCARIIARRQPTARDLRLIISIIKIITDLERIGDVASSVAKMVLNGHRFAEQSYAISLEPLTMQAIAMLHKTLDAFARMNVESAATVHQLDEQLDNQCNELTKELIERMKESSDDIPQILNVMWSARAMTRVGDRCQNICEYIVYFVTGKDIRHKGESGFKEVD